MECKKGRTVSHRMANGAFICLSISVVCDIDFMLSIDMFSVFGALLKAADILPFSCVLCSKVFDLQ